MTSTLFHHVWVAVPWQLVAVHLSLLGLIPQTCCDLLIAQWARMGWSPRFWPLCKVQSGAFLWVSFGEQDYLLVSLGSVDSRPLWALAWSPQMSGPQRLVEGRFWEPLQGRSP